VTHEKARRLVLRAQEVRGGHEIGHVRGEVGPREVALAFAEAREVEAEDGEPAIGQGARDVPRGAQVLRAREAVGEERVPAELAPRPLEARGQLLALGAAEREPGSAQGRTSTRSRSASTVRW
jgi:hypothetical protein